MSIVNATAEEIAAMKARFYKKQVDKIFEAQMDEVVHMVSKNHPFAKAPKQEVPIKKYAETVKAVALGMVASFGAIFWNVTSNKYGLILFACS